MTSFKGAATGPETSTKRLDEGWKREEWAKAYLEAIRGGIPLYGEQVEAMLRLIEENRRPVEKVLDLGCGDGVLASYVLGRRPGAGAVLVDFSDAMLKEAVRRFEGNAGVKVVRADFGVPGWVGEVSSHAPFDAIVSGYAIHHQTDERKKALYGEIFGLLSPGGIFLNMEHVASASDWGRQLFERLFMDSARSYARRTGLLGKFDEEELRRRKDKEANVLAPVCLQVEWLKEAGFTDADCYFKYFELALFGGRRPI